MITGQDHPAVQWVSAEAGEIPENAFRVGGKAIGRGVDNRGGTQPGYVCKSKKALVIEYGNSQMLIPNYEVLVSAQGYNALTESETSFKWVHASGFLEEDKFDFTPLKVGTENEGKSELYIARVLDDGEWVIGKAGIHLPGIHYVKSGVAKIGKDYEVLIIKTEAIE